MLIKKCALITMYHTHHCNSTAQDGMADSTSDLAIYCKESVVRGHHVFKRIWTPVVGEVLTVAREAGNTEDRFAVAVTKDDMVAVSLTEAISTRELLISDECVKLCLGSHAVCSYRTCAYALNKL